MELPRSPSGLRKFVVQIMEKVQSDRVERHRGILKKGLYKQFLEELVPLSHFSVWAYPDSCKIQWVSGNQGYDALVFSETGDEVDRVEITWPHDGTEEAVDSRLIVERGRGRVRTGHPGDDFDALIPYVLAGCRKKAEKDYSDCTLVVVINPDPPFQTAKTKADYEVRTEMLVSEMEQVRFNAKRVFLLFLPWEVVGHDSYEIPARIPRLFNAAGE